MHTSEYVRTRRKLYLPFNQLSGPIPASIGALLSLEYVLYGCIAMITRNCAVHQCLMSSSVCDTHHFRRRYVMSFAIIVIIMAQLISDGPGDFLVFSRVHK